MCLCAYGASGQIRKEQLVDFKKVIPAENVVVHTNKKVFLAGETVQPPSINGALVSGRNAGNAAMASTKHAL